MVGMGLERYHPVDAGGACWEVEMLSQMHAYCRVSPEAKRPVGGALCLAWELGCARYVWGIEQIGEDSSIWIQGCRHPSVVS
jgi:hypothetical protein